MLFTRQIAHLTWCESGYALLPQVIDHLTCNSLVVVLLSRLPLNTLDETSDSPLDLT